MGITHLFEFLICFSVYIILRFDIFVNYFLFWMDILCDVTVWWARYVFLILIALKSTKNLQLIKNLFTQT